MGDRGAVAGRRAPRPCYGAAARLVCRPRHLPRRRGAVRDSFAEILKALEFDGRPLVGAGILAGAEAIHDKLHVPPIVAALDFPDRDNMLAWIEAFVASWAAISSFTLLNSLLCKR